MRAAPWPALQGWIGRYGRLILFLALFFGWLDAVPLFGPVSAAWATAKGAAATSLFLWFLGAHGVALVLWGFLWDRRPPWARFGGVGAPVVCLALTLLLTVLPPRDWLGIYVAMGVVAAAGIVAWGRWYATTVDPAHLGRAFALAAAGVDVTVWLFDDLSKVMAPHTLLLLALVPLAAAAVVAAGLPQGQPVAPVSILEKRPRPSPVTVIRIGFFVALFSVVAGFSYRFFVVAPITPYVDDAMRRLPYLITILGVGWLADRRSLLVALVAGAGGLALAFLIGAWGQPTAQYFGMVLNGASFGMLEQAPWLLLAAGATTVTAGRWFGWGLNLNVVPIFIGSGLTPLTAGMSTNRLGLLAAVALLLAIVSLQGVSDPLAALREPVVLPGQAQRPGRLSLEELLAQSYGTCLTERELAIGRLAVRGVETVNIAGQLFISENTVKTHLRKLYRKTGAANRSDLMRKLFDRAGAPPA